MHTHRILPLAGYTPTIGRLVAMLSYARHTTFKAVEGLTREQLDHQHDDRSNSIGALLAHIAAVNRGYHLVTFEEREPSAAEQDRWGGALKLGGQARREIRAHELQFYLNELRQGREATLEALAARDDTWLEAPLRIAPTLNAHWAWFHVAEEEINHRGQIRWLRARCRSCARWKPESAIGVQREGMQAIGEPLIAPQRIPLWGNAEVHD